MDYEQVATGFPFPENKGNRDKYLKPTNNNKLNGRQLQSAIALR